MQYGAQMHRGGVLSYIHALFGPLILGGWKAGYWAACNTPARPTTTPPARQVERKSQNRKRRRGPPCPRPYLGTCPRAGARQRAPVRLRPHASRLRGPAPPPNWFGFWFVNRTRTANWKTANRRLFGPAGVGGGRVQPTQPSGLSTPHWRTQGATTASG